MVFLQKFYLLIIDKQMSRTVDLTQFLKAMHEVSTESIIPNKTAMRLDNPCLSYANIDQNHSNSHLTIDLYINFMSRINKPNFLN